jgi:hypothetical protein
LNKGK